MPTSSNSSNSSNASNSGNGSNTSTSSINPQPRIYATWTMRPAHARAHAGSPTALYYTILYYSMLCYIILYHTTLYYTILYCAITDNNTTSLYISIHNCIYIYIHIIALILHPLGASRVRAPVVMTTCRSSSSEDEVRDTIMCKRKDRYQRTRQIPILQILQMLALDKSYTQPEQLLGGLMYMYACMCICVYIYIYMYQVCICKLYMNTCINIYIYAQTLIRTK